ISEPEPTAPEPEPAPIILEPEPPAYRYVNMMDIVVEERLLEFIHRFDVCTCDRCVKDVKALTLNNLPPKYLVVPIASIAPLTSFYRNKYNIYAITELTKACLAVLENPRH
ncbi:MAG: late competence development ComFB family protein, partial [Hungatella sp.]